MFYSANSSTIIEIHRLITADSLINLFSGKLDLLQLFDFLLIFNLKELPWGNMDSYWDILEILFEPQKPDLIKSLQNDILTKWMSLSSSSK